MICAYVYIGTYVAIIYKNALNITIVGTYRGNAENAPTPVKLVGGHEVFGCFW